MKRSFRRVWKAALLTLLVDSTWYRANYPDIGIARVWPVWHFIRHGARERRNPDRGIYTAEVLRFDREKSHLRRLRAGFLRKQRAILASELVGAPRPIDQLVVFFNIATDQLSGGMLSIDRFAGLARQHFEQTGAATVLTSSVPLGRESYAYTRFTPSMPSVHFSVIVRETNPAKVLLMLPEYYAIDFVRTLDDTMRAWLAGRVVEIVILDQNNSLMPHPADLQAATTEITTAVTIATAHETYTTQDLADRFSYPVKGVTPLLPDLKPKPFSKKRPIVMVSPDRPDGDTDGDLREQFIEDLEHGLPDLEIVTVKDLTLNEYLELASDCVIAITLGEGLDGYFIEPVLAGGVSFAVANPSFFPPSFEGCFSIALSLDDLLERVISAWQTYKDSPEAYARDSGILRDLVGGLYSREKTVADLEDLLEGRVDFEPVAELSAAKPFENLEDFLALEGGFRFVDSARATAVAVTPNKEVIEHFGGEFYSVLYEIYSSRDYDALLKPSGRPTVLFDIGANVGAASIYLSKNEDIRAIYAYEPVASVERVARRNIERNVSIPVHVKCIALSDRFAVEKAELIDGWTTAFSVDRPVLNGQLKVDSTGRHSVLFRIEVEIVPASVEMASVIAENPGSRFIVKCDVQGSEFQIVDDLDRAGLLDKFDVLVIESHFSSPTPIIDALTRAGFTVTSRCDSEANEVYLIVAEKPPLNQPL